jgi:hypothetical protein
MLLKGKDYRVEGCNSAMINNACYILYIYNIINGKKKRKKKEGKTKEKSKEH